jgi:hypothetical protein
MSREKNWRQKLGEQPYTLQLYALFVRLDSGEGVTDATSSSEKLQ